MRSTVVLHEVATGAQTALLTVPGRIEAPNFAADGRSLMVNGGGRLFLVPLDAPALDPVPTGPLRALNNDHGLSPDGRWLAVSDKGGADGRSRIHLLPAAGGDAPRRLTDAGPSWWHGWTPDSAAILYAAVRAGRFALCRMALGGPEQVLLAAEGPLDGPDAGPDGTLWFNGDPDGVGMRLWRMASDGADPRPVTDGASVDWFPHPSPDGRWLVWLVYPAGTAGHPADVTVHLRLRDLSAGTDTDLPAFPGGQGALNVPCWSPDSRRFGFVRHDPEEPAA